VVSGNFAPGGSIPDTTTLHPHGTTVKGNFAPTLGFFLTSHWKVGYFGVKVRLQIVMSLAVPGNFRGRYTGGRLVYHLGGNMQLLYFHKLGYDEEEILTVAEILKGRSSQRDLCPLPIRTAERQGVELDSLAA
jgi:hypothetical protein